MIVSAILKCVMLELDEDPADIVDYEEKFRMYLNMGYQLILRKYYKPRDTVIAYVNEQGYLYLDGFDFEEIVEMQTIDGKPVTYEAHPDGRQTYQTSVRATDVAIVGVVNCPPLENNMDEPRLPEHVHYALVSYICYKHLSSGNLAKQSRAQYYLQSFYEVMSTLKPTGSGTVTNYKNFYSATN